MTVGAGIEDVGRQVSIIRTPNISSYMWIPDMRQKTLDPYTDFNVAAWLPIESGVVSGDLILCDSEYYLVVARNKQEQFGEDLYYRVHLYKCNSVVTIYAYNNATEKFDSVVKSGVRCLITQSTSAIMEDKAIAVGNYQGKTSPFKLYMRSTEGLTNECILIDQGNRNFRVNKDMDIFVENGIVQAEVMWER